MKEPSSTTKVARVVVGFYYFTEVCMKNILVSPSDIESCWEKNDACFVKMKSGKVWVCMKYLYFEPNTLDIHIINGKQITKTLDLIKHLKDEKFIELPLQIKRGG